MGILKRLFGAGAQENPTRPELKGKPFSSSLVRRSDELLSSYRHMGVLQNYVGAEQSLEEECLGAIGIISHDITQKALKRLNRSGSFPPGEPVPGDIGNIQAFYLFVAVLMGFIVESEGVAVDKVAIAKSTATMFFGKHDREEAADYVLGGGTVFKTLLSELEGSGVDWRKALDRAIQGYLAHPEGKDVQHQEQDAIRSLSEFMMILGVSAGPAKTG